MLIRKEVKDFEKLGFGMFVHFGAYSVLGRGEWAKLLCNIPYERYNAEAVEKFNPDPDWAENLVLVAKDAGCKYITLTTRHHDGFSLFDTCGLNEYDTVHTIGRDLVREFADACRKHDIIPFFYHTLVDWHYPCTRVTCFGEDFRKYLQYLRDSVELLCKNYGEIGGLWFDGMWDRPDDDWEEDALYGVIRKYQPHCIIVNNTGLVARGKKGHFELDSVTFECGLPSAINREGDPKYLAMEMCETLGVHWGYTSDDFHFESPAHFIRELAQCRKYGANMLLNVGPKADGSLRKIDQAVFEVIGQWVKYNEEAIRTPHPTDLTVTGGTDGSFVLRNEEAYYLFCFDMPRSGNVNVTLASNPQAMDPSFSVEGKVVRAEWLDNGESIDFEQTGEQAVFHTKPFPYGRDLVIRVAKIVTVTE